MSKLELRYEENSEKCHFAPRPQLCPRGHGFNSRWVLRFFLQFFGVLLSFCPFLGRICETFGNEKLFQYLCWCQWCNWKEQT
jgi:hypothetical protein